jgi:hypothetical protein
MRYASHHLAFVRNLLKLCRETSHFACMFVAQSVSLQGRAPRGLEGRLAAAAASGRRRRCCSKTVLLFQVKHTELGVRAI